MSFVLVVGGGGYCTPPASGSPPPVGASRGEGQRGAADKERDRG